MSWPNYQIGAKSGKGGKGGWVHQPTPWEAYPMSNNRREAKLEQQLKALQDKFLKLEQKNLAPNHGGKGADASAGGKPTGKGKGKAKGEQVPATQEVTVVCPQCGTTHLNLTKYRCRNNECKALLHPLTQPVPNAALVSSIPKHPIHNPKAESWFTKLGARLTFEDKGPQQ